MDARELIAAYERILGITGGMLQAAREEEWDRLVALEKTCRTEIDRLVALGDDTPELPSPLRARKAQIIRDVLADDAEIRRLVEPGLARLEQLIGDARNQRRLVQAYGAT